MNNENTKDSEELLKREKGKKIRRNVVIIILIIIIILLLLLLFWKGHNKVETTTSTPVMEWVPEAESGDGVAYIKLPGYSTTYYLSSDKRDLPLVNLSDNDDNIVYELTHAGQVILTTSEIAPGETINADLYSYFGEPGEYYVDIKAYAILSDTGKEGYPTNFSMCLVIE